MDGVVTIADLRANAERVTAQYEKVIIPELGTILVRQLTRGEGITCLGDLDLDDRDDALTYEERVVLASIAEPDLDALGEEEARGLLAGLLPDQYRPLREAVFAANGFRPETGASDDDG